MKSVLSIYRTLPRYNSAQPSAVTIGNFDGVHLGHQTILERVRREAIQLNLSPSVVTFTPHPRVYFAQRGNRPELIPTQISTLRDKLTLLADHGMAQIVLAKFNQEFADMEAEHFIQQLLVKGLNTKWLLVGEDFRFGHQRSGNIESLRNAGERYGFTVETVADIADEQGRRISSSELRTALAVGNMTRSAELLGRPYQLSGHVVHGKKLGRTLGYPTLNLPVPPLFAAKSGVYVVRAYGLGPGVLQGIASLGVRPTVTESGTLLLEVHLLDSKVDAYGKLVKIELLDFVREEEKFPDLQTMIAAIDNDVRCAREYFAAHGL
ncbi:bifunctional riboflavin kinase/FAD synthetase [Paenalcaligenes niemegkensis]|uniref:bifunctional riboflavin kinase/FAD synthetase n=1 Tax=Paenalcaligenes niemegkensis TaxID=2895469 RepID=UPI001EE897B1|nr:bifunctional riboflavin kinase/FAD synthetase [Paenalcaligenes niemegkensis]MCQ9616600.1 bifunctional riboflavin kinase/FAD synthetase [Paenalcaligenes niemegkensis]